MIDVQLFQVSGVPEIRPYLEADENAHCQKSPNNKPDSLKAPPISWGVLRGRFSTPITIPGRPKKHQRSIGYRYRSTKTQAPHGCGTGLLAEWRALRGAGEVRSSADFFPPLFIGGSWSVCGGSAEEYP